MTPPGGWLVLVRHALPVPVPGMSPRSWVLGADGRTAARALALALPAEPVLVASSETKARQTAAEIAAVRGGSVAVDERLDEVRRPAGWVGDHRRLAGEYVAGRLHAGWEPQDEVGRRFGAAVAAALDAADRRPVVLVTHGQAMTGWLTTLGVLPDPEEFWRALSFPDAWSVPVPDGALRPRGLTRLRRS